MEFIFAYGAGLLTLINPCVLPVLPIAVAAGLQAGRLGPLALALGMSLSFTIIGLVVTAVGPSVGISPETVSRVAALFMVAFGIILLVPAFSAQFALATAGIANSASRKLAGEGGEKLAGQFVGGALLGAAWAPCIGPTLGGAIALASTGSELLRAGGIMAAFSLGVSTLILGFAYGARGFLSKGLGWSAHWVRPVLGAAFVAVGISTFLGWTDVAAGALLDVMPTWLQDASVAI
jgi:cytochrome c-type biogenesis protein